MEGQPIRVEVKGIEYMNDDPGEVDVLYGCVQTTSWKDSLQEMADDIVRKLIKAGNLLNPLKNSLRKWLREILESKI